jgi:hypothetical protein
MDQRNWDEGDGGRLPLLLLAGLGAAGAAWWLARREGRHDSAPGLRARLVPLKLARQEAHWTHEALKSK